MKIEKYDNGRIKSEIVIDDNGKPHGFSMFYDSLGHLLLKNNYKHGHLNGWSYKFLDGIMYDSSYFVNDSIRLRYNFDKYGNLKMYCENEMTCSFYEYYKNGGIFKKYYSHFIRDKKGLIAQRLTDSVFIYRKNTKLLSSTRAIGDTLIIKFDNALIVKSYRFDDIKLKQITSYRYKLLGSDTCEIEFIKCN